MSCEIVEREDGGVDIMFDNLSEEESQSMFNEGLALFLTDGYKQFDDPLLRDHLEQETDKIAELLTALGAKARIFRNVHQLRK